MNPIVNALKNLSVTTVNIIVAFIFFIITAKITIALRIFVMFKNRCKDFLLCIVFMVLFITTLILLRIQ
ncbi:hypothetical protein DFR86_00785 [Acidianus sulfidivorans JP7]|nr:hypothetical protein DFR86_00785 [Acidianus sulfidivorans JP7]